MSIYTPGPDTRERAHQTKLEADRLATLRADLDQLRLPIPRPPARQRVRISGKRVRGWRQLDPLPPLLNMLRSAADGRHTTTSRGPERRPKPGSRPPGNLDATDLLSRLYVELSGWHAGLNLPSPPVDRHGCNHRSCRSIVDDRLPGPPCPTAGRIPILVDWQRYALRQLHDESRRWTPDTVAAVADDAHRWWRWAAAAAGLSQDELLALRA